MSKNNRSNCFSIIWQNMKKDDNSLHEDLRKSAIRLGLLALPGALITLGTEKLVGTFAAQPWQTLWILVPLAVLNWIFWQVTKGRKEFKLGGVFLAFLLTYVVIFSVAAGRDLGSWKSPSLIGYDKSVPRNWLSLGWMGDWRYLIVRKKPATPGLTIVTMKPPQTVLAGRLDISNLIKLAADNDATGIALDFHFKKKTRLDGKLCEEIEKAQKKRVKKVLVSYNVSDIAGKPRREPIVASLEECLPLESHQGYPAGYAESDGVIRLIPLYFRVGGKGRSELEALSLKIAKLFGNEIKTPENGLLQFIEPKEDFELVTYKDFKDNPGIARDQVVLVGEESDKHKFSTPFGDKPGVVIQAYAVHSFVQDHFIKRTKLWPNYLMIFVFCYLITVRVKQGDSVRKLIRTNSLISCVIFAISALAMYVSLIWIDIIYSLLALWLLLPLLLVLRKTSNR